jgi:hypothetical protein
MYKVICKEPLTGIPVSNKACPGFNAKKIFMVVFREGLYIKGLEKWGCRLFLPGGCNESVLFVFQDRAQAIFTSSTGGCIPGFVRIGFVFCPGGNQPAQQHDEMQKGIPGSGTGKNRFVPEL